MPAARKPDAEAALRNPRGQGDRLRASLLEAANDLLLESGGDMSRFSVRGVTRRAGVSPMALYLHFADLDELMHALFAQNFAELRARVGAAYGSASDPVEQLRRGGRAYVEWGLERPGNYRVIFSLPDLFPDAVAERLERDEWIEMAGEGAATFEDLVEVVQRCIDAGVAGVDNAWVAATGIWVTLHGITTLQWCLSSFPWPDVDLLIDRAIAGHMGIAIPAR